MKTRLLMMALAASTLALAGLFGACGGGGGALTLEEYFEELEGLLQEADDRGDELSDQFDEDIEAADDEDEEAELSRALVDDILSIGEELLGDLEDLDAPDEVADEHDEYVEAVNGGVEALQGIADEAEDAESRDDIEALFGEDEFTEAGENVDDACLELQEIADDEDIDVDLNCGEDAGGEPAPTEELPTLEEPTPDTSGAELEDYFFQLETLTVPFFRDVTAAVDAPDLSGAAFFDEVLGLLDDFTAQLAEIDAADEVVDEDLELFAAADDYRLLLEDAPGRLLEGVPEAELSADIEAGVLRLLEACLVLQDIADANAIFVDLGCLQ